MSSDERRKSLADAIAALQGTPSTPPIFRVKSALNKQQITNELDAILDSQFASLDALIAEIQLLLKKSSTSDEAGRLTDVAQEQLRNIKRLQKLSSTIISSLD